MARWAVGLLVVCLLGSTGMAAAERAPASLVPAQASVYHELNLAQWHLGGKGARSLEEVFEQIGLMPAQRAVAGRSTLLPGPVDSLRESLKLMWGALDFVGPRLGFINAAAASPEGGAAFLAVAEVKDRAALLEATRRLLRDNHIAHREEARADGVTVFSVEEGPAAAIGSDWAALCSPPALLGVVTRLAASGGEGSLAADPRYQRAVQGLPEDALLIEYASPELYSFLSDFITSASRPAPGVPFPGVPADGIAWAFRAAAEPSGGRRMLHVTWTMDADTSATFAATGVFALMFPVFDRARESARKTHCQANVRELTAAMKAYADRTGHFPKADRWTTALGPFVSDPEVFRCPDDRSEAACSYAMNWAFSGKPKSAGRDADRQVLIYETAHSGPCPRGARTDLASPPRHLGGNNFGLLDGTAKWLPEYATQDPAAVW